MAHLERTTRGYLRRFTCFAAACYWRLVIAGLLSPIYAAAKQQAHAAVKLTESTNICVDNVYDHSCLLIVHQINQVMIFGLLSVAGLSWNRAYRVQSTDEKHFILEYFFEPTVYSSAFCLPIFGLRWHFVSLTIRPILRLQPLFTRQSRLKPIDARLQSHRLSITKNAFRIHFPSTIRLL